MKNKLIMLGCALALAATFSPTAHAWEIFGCEVKVDIRKTGKCIWDKAKSAGEAEFNKYSSLITAATDGDLKDLVKYAVEQLPVDKFPILKPLVNAVLAKGSWADKFKAAGASIMDALKTELQTAVDTLKAGANGLTKWTNTAETSFKNKLIESFKSQLSAADANTLKAQAATKNLAELGLALFKNIVKAKLIDPVLNKVDGWKQDAIAFVVDKLVGKVTDASARLDALNGIATDLANGKKADAATKCDAAKLTMETLLAGVRDLAFNWLRDKAVGALVPQLMKVVNELLDLAYVGVAAARTALQTAVGEIPFAGGFLAGAVGVAIDAVWKVGKDALTTYVIEPALTDLLNTGFDKIATATGLAKFVLDKLNSVVTAVKADAATKLQPYLDKHNAVVTQLKVLATAK